MVGTSLCIAVALCAALSSCSPDEHSVTPSESGPSTGKKGRIIFTAEVRRGEEYSHSINENLEFRLIPVADYGWDIWIGGRNNLDEDYIGVVTPPYRGINTKQIYGWHFRNVDNSGTNTPGPNSVNAPQEERDFCFVLNRGDYQSAWNDLEILLWRNPRSKEYSAAEKGHESLSKRMGQLTIQDLRLGNLIVGKQAWIDYMRFEVEIRLPSGIKR
ncbi:MAG: hypothetical protein QGD94_09435 [Planctomycetia bacterium]|nr:hypothetical protein [Planctomycetia bacterium]